MGSGRTLLERISDPEGEGPRSVTEDTERLAGSILRHLRNMLNTRQGHVPIQPEYGMPDVTEFIQTLPETVDGIRRAIRNSIEKFEPRLRNVDVRYVPSEEDPLHLRFEITADLATAKEEAAVWFVTAVSPSGHIDVRG